MGIFARRVGYVLSVAPLTVPFFGLQTVSLSGYSFMTVSRGRLVAVEVKGEDRDNSDSERKLRLGRKWAERAGDNYHYYMVFNDLNWKPEEGAYNLSEFMGLMRKL